MTVPATARRARAARRLAGPTAALALAVLALGACSPGSDPGATTTDRTRETTMAETPGKNGTGEVRTDLEPLTKRFSALGTPVAATWLSGTVGDDDVPGPSTYWIDAVVRLTPDAASALRAHSPAPTSETPAVEDGVRSALPSGGLLRSDALDAAFAQGSFRAKAYLSADSDTVVLVALGQ